MSITLVLEHELDVSRGDLLATGTVDVGSRFSTQMVWMDERALDPHRTYLLKHTTRTVTAQTDTPLELNQIGTVTVTTSRSIAVDPYSRNRTTGSFVLIDPATNFTAGAGMIVRAERSDTVRLPDRDAAERLARAAREAATHGEAIEAVRQVLEDILT